MNGPEPPPFLLQMTGKPLASWRADSTQHELVTVLTEVRSHAEELRPVLLKSLQTR